MIKCTGVNIMCMACLRFKFSPIHWLVRGLGICPGDKLPKEFR